MARTVEYGCFFMKTSVIFFRGTTHFLPNVKRYAVSPSYICRQKKSRKFMKENVKETLDFGTMEVSRLFRKLFFPTLLGMVFSAVFVITDGIFVGRGIGSDALAAVNITAPLFLINTGIGLMFGVGASVAASIALSRGRERLARAYITQSVYVGSLLLVLLWGIVLCFSPQVARFFGSSERLLPLALEYMHWFLPFFVFSALLNSGMFFVRLDGSPRYAMLCNVVPALINIALDYWFIFGLGWGMMGAALATSLGYILGALMIVGYLLRPTITLRLMSLQRTRSGWRQLCRHTRTIMRLGLSSFLCEAAIATMMFVGNYVFMHYLYEDGVAAFSIACYFFPIIFMVYNAIAQSAQPILSYNHGCGACGRVHQALRQALITAVAAGALCLAVTALFSPQIVRWFLEPHYPAYALAVEGLPLFACGFVFFGVNIVSIGYFQSLERDRMALLITLLRGFVFIVLCFGLLPLWLGAAGIWLAVPMAELLTFLFLVTVYCRREK